MTFTDISIQSGTDVGFGRGGTFNDFNNDDSLEGN